MMNVNAVNEKGDELFEKLKALKNEIKYFLDVEEIDDDPNTLKEILEWKQTFNRQFKFGL